MTTSRQWIRYVVIVGLVLVVGAALWGSPEQQRELSSLLRNVNHALWAGVNAERLFGRQ